MLYKNRQTGRTSALLDQAIAENKLFIVHAHQMIGYCESLRPQMRGKIISVGNHEAMRGITNPVVDHSVWELSSAKDIANLKKVMSPGYAKNES